MLIKWGSWWASLSGLGWRFQGLSVRRMAPSFAFALNALGLGLLSAAS